MKAEHRKELKTNVLADQLGHVIEGVKSGPSWSTILVIGGLILVVLGIFGGRYLYRSHLETRSQGWMQVDDAERKLSEASTGEQVETALKDLSSTMSQQEGTTSARVGQFIRARALLGLGVERLGSTMDQPKAIERIKEARDLYSKLADQTRDTPVLAQEALMGVAKASESLGEVEAALDAYEKLARAYPKSVLGERAAKRAEYLNNEENQKKVKAFYQALVTTSPEAGGAPPTP